MMTAEKDRASAWFRDLRDQIVAAFEALEDSHDAGPFAEGNAGRFDVTRTSRRRSRSSLPRVVVT